MGDPRKFLHALTRSAVALVASMAMLVGLTGSAGAATKAPKPDRNAELRFAITFGWVGPLDPHRTLSAPSDGLFLRPVYDSLLRITKDAKGATVLAPQLATAYKPSADGRTFDLTLRSGVKFQDGNPFNAAAVKANLERAKDAKSTTATPYKNLAGVVVKDDTHVTLQLTDPDPAFPWTLATYTYGMMISPAAMNNADLATKPVGSGPYTLVSANKSAATTYQRWDGYWDKTQNPAAKLSITLIIDGNARLNALQTGQFDVATFAPPQDVQARALPKSGYVSYVGAAPTELGLAFDHTKPPFNDVRVRQAIWLALNRADIIKSLVPGYFPAYQPFAKGLVGYVPELEKTPYNMTKAKGLMKQANIAPGTTVKMITTSDGPYGLVQPVVQQVLGDLGIKVEITNVTSSALRGTFARGGYQMAFVSITGQPDPSVTMTTTYLKGALIMLQDPPAELVDLYNKALKTVLGSADRTKAFQAIGRYLVANPVHIPIMQTTTTIVGRMNLIGIDKLIGSSITEIDFRGVGISKA